MKTIVYFMLGLAGILMNISCSDDVDEQINNQEPMIVSLSTHMGTAKDIITVYGRSFSRVKSENTVKFNGLTAIVLEADAGELQVVLPEIDEGTFNIEITINNKIIVGPAFTFKKPTDNGWVVQTIVGQSGVPAMTDGIGTQATCKLPTSLSFAPDGSIWFSDRGNFAIRRISPDVNVTTIAGSPTSDSFFHPWQGNFDSNGNYFIADKGNHRVQKVTAVTHEVSTFATGFKNPMSLVFDDEDNMYVADRDNKAIKKITPDGQVTSFGIGITPNTLVFTPQGDLIIGGSANYTLIKLTLSSGDVTTIAGDGVKGTNYNDGEPGNPLTAKVGQIFGLSCDAAGNIYIADALYHVIQKFTPGENGDYAKGTIKTIAGTGVKGTENGKALSAKFNTPYAVLVTEDGKTIYVADTVPFLIRKLTYR